MAKKKKKVRIVEKVDPLERPTVDPPPPCYGCREEYCIPDLCGAWFQTCKKS